MPIYAMNTRQYREEERKVLRLSKEIYRHWFANPNTDQAFYDTHIETRMKEIGIPHKRKKTIVNLVYEDIEEWAKEWYKRQLNTNQETFDYIDSLVDDDIPFPPVRMKVHRMISRWRKDVENRPAPVLEDLAQDGQNVHTGAVNKQMFETLEILKKTPIPIDQNTQDEILTEWMKTKGYTETVEKIMEDIHKWGAKKTLFKKDDYLYRVIFRSLWAKIKTFEGDTFKELVQRLYEECEESLGMCAHGHISRLTNVLSGFDEAFLSPVSRKELFQGEIARLSEMTDMDAKEMAKKAYDLFDEYDISEEEHEVWFEALNDSWLQNKGR